MKPTNKPMKRLSLYLFLIFFTLQTPSKADDIRDFQIEGMSIGDSLLDYFSEEEIKSRKQWFYPKSEKYYRINIIKEFEEYDHITFHIKKGDKKYIIESIKGVRYFENNHKECLKFKKEMVQDISSFLQKPEDRTYDGGWPDGRAKVEATDFTTSGGYIRIWCADWIKAKEEKGYKDGIFLTITPQKIYKWLGTAQ